MVIKVMDAGAEVEGVEMYNVKADEGDDGITFDGYEVGAAICYHTTIAKTFNTHAR